MATSRSEDRILRTTDLTLASYLLVEGFTSDQVEYEGEQVKPGHPQGAWEFEETPTLKRCVEEFNSGDALVEPKSFHQKVNATRKEMFNFLGIGTR